MKFWVFSQNLEPRSELYPIIFSQLICRVRISVWRGGGSSNSLPSYFGHMTCPFIREAYSCAPGAQSQVAHHPPSLCLPHPPSHPSRSLFSPHSLHHDPRVSRSFCSATCFYWNSIGTKNRDNWCYSRNGDIHGYINSEWYFFLYSRTVGMGRLLRLARKKLKKKW